MAMVTVRNKISFGLIFYSTQLAQLHMAIGAQLFVGVIFFQFLLVKLKVIKVHKKHYSYVDWSSTAVGFLVQPCYQMDEHVHQ